MHVTSARLGWGQVLVCLLAIPAIVASCANMPQATPTSGLVDGQSAGGPPAGGPPAGDPPKHPLAYYHFLLGQQAEIEKNAELAIEEYLAALRSDPTSVFLKAKLASLYFSNGKVAEAVRFADRVAGADVKDAKILVQTAGIYAGAGNTEQALSLYDRAILAEPEHSDAYFSKGLLLINLKRYEEAERSFTLGMAYTQNNPIGHYYLGRIELEKGQPDAAIGHFEQAIETRPTFEPAHIALASAHEHQGNRVQAKAVYKHYLAEVDPNSNEVRQRLIRLHLRDKEFADALTLLAQILAENPHDLEAQLRVSLVYGELKEYGKAIEQLRQILAVRPAEIRVRDYLGLMYEESKDFDQAVKTYRTNLELQPEYYDGHMHLGFLLYKLHRYSEAIPHFETTVRLDPRKPDGFILLGLTHLQAKDYEQALQAFQDGVEHNPSSPDLHFNLGTAYDKLDRFAEVVQAMETALRLDPEHAEALNYLGYSYADRGINIEEALALTQRAVALKPDNGYYVDSLGWAFFKMGRIEDALKEIQRAAMLVNDDPVIYEHLGEIYYEQGHLDEAIKAWRRSLELDADNKQLIERVRERGLAEDLLNGAISKAQPDPAKPTLQ